MGRVSHLMLRAKYKLFPPPIKSPYLYHPQFAREMRSILSLYASHASKIVEFGCLHGWSTVIMARTTPGFVQSFDNFTRGNTYQGTWNNICKAGFGGKVRLGYCNFFDWLADPPEFDLLYLDVNNTPAIIGKAYGALMGRIEDGATVLFEGAARFDAGVPHNVLCSLHPGIGVLK